MKEIVSSAREALRPATKWQSRPSGALARDPMVRAYFLMRSVNGLLGLFLPVIVIAGDIWWFHNGLPLRGSVSAYYHSDMRDIFVGILFVIGFFLILHKLFRRDPENLVSVIAGVAAIGVALFPTSVEEKSDRPMHVVFAVVFIACLGLISLFFGIRESHAPREQGPRTAIGAPRFWKWFHYSMAGLIAFAGGFIGFMSIWDASGTAVIGWLDEYSVLIGEIIVAIAFGLSWMTKGSALELDLKEERKLSTATATTVIELAPQDAV